jgi:hypothetical protein
VNPAVLLDDVEPPRLAAWSSRVRERAEPRCHELHAQAKLIPLTVRIGDEDNAGGRESADQDGDCGEPAPRHAGSVATRMFSRC